MQNDEDDMLYDLFPYLDAYAMHTDVRVIENPEEAVGGSWEDIGQLQFQFLLDHGLQPQNTLLDLGCGTLRGGHHIINYLDSDKYTGVDISEQAILWALDLVKDKGLSYKKPSLIHDVTKDFMFTRFEQEYDFILAQSVFTHLPPPIIRTFLENVPRFMSQDSTFFLTFNEDTEYYRVGNKDFYYPHHFFEVLALQNGLTIKKCGYNHPRGQTMIEVKKIQ